MTEKKFGILSLPVIVAALGYFVDIYDLLLFTIVKKSRKLRKNKMSKKNVQSKRNVGSGRNKGEQSIFLGIPINFEEFCRIAKYTDCLLYTSDAADE